MPRGGAGAGRYWERVKIYKRSTSTSNTGHETETWTEGEPLWCYTMPLKVDKKLAYSIMNSGIELEIRIRGFYDLDARDRLLVLTTGFYFTQKGFDYDYESGDTVVNAKRVPSLGSPE